MNKNQVLITSACPSSEQFQLVEVKVSQMPYFQLAQPVATECSVLAEKAEQCGRCLTEPATEPAG